MEKEKSEKGIMKIPKLGFWVIVIIFFFIGIGLGSLGDETPTEKVVTKEVKTIDLPREANWKKLKEVDDKGLAAAADAPGIVIGIFTAIQNHDIDATNKNNTKLQEKNTEIQNIRDERQMILKDLGY